MSTKTITETIVSDDFDPTIVTGVETLAFAVGGQNYEIDLCEANARVFLAAFTPYTTAGRATFGTITRITTRTRRAPALSRSVAEREQSVATRVWARNHGWPDMGDRGRIPVAVQSAFDAAHVA